jgi:hypothetical protein
MKISTIWLITPKKRLLLVYHQCLQLRHNTYVAGLRKKLFRLGTESQLPSDPKILLIIKSEPKPTNRTSDQYYTVFIGERQGKCSSCRVATYMTLTVA